MPRLSDLACAVSTDGVAEDSLLFSFKATGQAKRGDAKVKLCHRRVTHIELEALIGLRACLARLKAYLPWGERATAKRASRESMHAHIFTP
jgi:16S rRNA C1402 (ribose-2'-O) methylase RsmI